MTDDKEDIETDGGVVEDTDADSKLQELGEEIANHSVSRRSALAGIGSAAGLGSVGAATGSDIHVGDPAEGDGLLPPGLDTRVIEGTLESEDNVIDVSGGEGLGSAEYETVVDPDHPQPSVEQAVIPGDLLSEFSVNDRIFTTSHSGFDNASDHAYQSAGSTSDLFEHGPADWITPWVDEFVPYGYTVSEGPGGPCVETVEQAGFMSEPSIIPQACPWDQFDADPPIVHSTDICEVINPTIAFKVDSAGIAENEMQADVVSATITSLPITAADLEAEINGDIHWGEASHQAILVDEEGDVPPEAQGNGYSITYANDTITVTFQEDRTHAVLPNSGWISGVDRCALPRGDDSPCYEFECAEERNLDGTVESEGIPEGEEYGRSNITSGTRDTSQLGLQENFNSMDDGNFVRLSDISVPERDEREDPPDDYNVTGDVLVLADNYEDDEEELNGFTAFLDSVSVFDIDSDVLTDEYDGENGAILERQSRAQQASARPSTVLQTLHRHTSQPYGPISAGSNGFMQIPVDGTAEPQNEFQKGDPFRIENPTAGASDNATLLSRGEAGTGDNIADLVDTEADTQAFLSESEAYRELELREAQGFVPLGTDDDNTNDVGYSHDFPSEKWGATIAGSAFNTPTQILVGGQFNCDDGTPLEMGVNTVETEEWEVFLDDHTLENNSPPSDPVEYICVDLGNTVSDGDIIAAEDITLGTPEDGQAFSVQGGAASDAEVGAINSGELCFEVEMDPSYAPLTIDDIEWVHIEFSGLSSEPAIDDDTAITYYNGDPSVSGNEIYTGDPGFNWEVNQTSGEEQETGEPEFVDITHDERVSFEINEDQSTPSTGVDSNVTDDGVFEPHTGDTSDELVVVDILVDGCPVDQVAFLILTQNDVTVEESNTSRVTDLREEGLLDPAPSGEDVQAVHYVEPSWDGPSNANVGDNYEVDLTQLSTFSITGSSGAGVADVNHIKNGTVEIATLAPDVSDMTGEIEAVYDPAPSFTPLSDTQGYACNPDYFFGAVGWPSRDPYFGDNTPDQDIILVSPTDAGDASRVDGVCLEDGETIADTLEGSMNTVLEDELWREHPVLADDPVLADKPYEPEVEVYHDPDWHEAGGYLIHSWTRVESSFDQSVDVSSVEIESFHSLTEGGDEVLTANDLAVGHWEDLEMQDIQCALGFTGEDYWNWVNAETVINDDDDDLDDVFDQDLDRYVARADPLDLARGSPNPQEYLGDNELTCNELELGADLTLLGCEDPERLPDVDFFTQNPNVILYYDSWIGRIFDEADDAIAGVPIPPFPQGASPEPEEFITSDRPGAPNMTEGGLPCFPHAAEEIYEANDDLFDDHMPRFRFRMCLALSDGSEEPSQEVSTNPLFGTIGAALPFYEGFDIIEVRDSIVDAANPWFSELPDELRRDDHANRGLGPRNTWAHNVYGDRFDGLSVRNAGTLDLDSVAEHTLHMDPATLADGTPNPQRDWVEAGMDVDVAGGSHAPDFPSSRPDLVVFYGDQNITWTDCANFQNSPWVEDLSLSDNPVSRPGPANDVLALHTFTDNLGQEFWFGTGAEPELPGIDNEDGGDGDDHFGDGAESTHLTTCGTPVTDSLVFVVRAAVKNNVEGTLQYEVPQLYDWGKDGAGNGEYDYVHPGDPVDRHSATYQDRGVFFDSHDDEGDKFVDIGEIVIDLDAELGFAPCDAYDCESGSVSTQGLLDAIEDWRNGDLPVEDLLTAISSWRSA